VPNPSRGESGEKAKNPPGSKAPKRKRPKTAEEITDLPTLQYRDYPVREKKKKNFTRRETDVQTNISEKLE